MNSRQWILRARPGHEVLDSDLVLTAWPMKPLKDRQSLVRNSFLSVDPANRLWMNPDPVYMRTIPLDSPMTGLVMGVVVESRHPQFAAGNRVMGLGSWGDHSVANGALFAPVPHFHGIAPEEVFAIFQSVGPSAYFGIKSICRPVPGETLLVSGAAGAVGSIAGQLGKHLGCRVIGIAGGAEKCAMILREYGFDAAIDYKNEDIAERLEDLCANGVDCFFDNVGGPALDAALMRMSRGGRIAQCGLIGDYNRKEKSGPRQYDQIIYRGLTVSGFIATIDFAQRLDEAYSTLAELYVDGRLRWHVHVENGLDRALEALRSLYLDTFHGKMLVKII